MKNNCGTFVEIKSIITSVITFCFALSNLALAADSSKSSKDKPEQSEQSSEKVDVQAVKEKYWSSSEEKDLSVVQNRTFSKSKRFHLSASGGKTFGDPFLDITSVGGGMGYFFNEYIGIHVLFLRQLTTASDALKTFQATRNATANTNEPKYYLGAEVSYSLLYGKLSVVGKKIIYYDMYLTTGGGITDTESGKNFTYTIGLGQRFFLSQTFSLRLDYRYISYHETIREKVIPTKIGQDVADRQSINHAILLSIDYFFGSSGGSK